MALFRNNFKILTETGKQTFLLLFLGFIAASAFSQKITDNLSDDRFSEELYINTDRDLYIAGENVWMKIYKLNRAGHLPADISKVIYIDLLDVHNNPVIQMKAGIEGTSGASGFVLPDTLSTGYYIIRSYTNWMKNFSGDLFSYKKISVINPFENVSKLKIPDTFINPDSVLFLPESGHFINGIETRIGIKTLNRDGKPVKMQNGFILDNTDTLCRVHTDNNGCGWATVRSSQRSRIKLISTDHNRKTKVFQFPDTEKDGIALSVKGTEEDSPILAVLNRSNNFKIGKLYLTAGIAGQRPVRSELSFGTGNAANLLKRDFPSGLFQIVVSDEQNNILINRYLYNKPEQDIHFNIDVDNSASLREKVIVGIKATDNTGAPVESDFSISVVKSFTAEKTKYKPSQNPGLISLTGSDINDFLIFCTPSGNILNEVSGIIPIFLPELEGHLISGNIKDRKTGLPLKNENISLSFIGLVALCQFTRTDENGNFNFVTSETGLREIVIQPLSQDIHDCYVDLTSSFTSSDYKYNQGLLTIDTTILDDINNAVISMQVKKIYDPFVQPPLKKEIVQEKPDFYGAPDSKVQMSEYIELTSLKEVIKEIMPGVSTVKKNNKTRFRLINKYQSMAFENDPLVLVDGVPVNDIDKVINISSRDIERIDVLTTRYFISDIVLDGILHFVSKTGNLKVIDFDRSVYRLQYELPQYTKEFYSPDYSSDTARNSRIPDFRNTLYWDPLLKTDKTGKAEVEFYSSDESTDYLIIVEGLSPDGRTGRTTTTLKINRQY